MGLLARTVTAAGSRELRFGGHFADPFAEPEILSVAEAFDRYAGIDLFATLDEPESGRAALAAGASSHGIRIAADDSWRDIFSKILSAKIEPQLGHGRPTILMDYPASEAALAKLQEDPRFAERFELYACGVELANGFGELTDATLQRRRFEAAMAERLRIYGETYPIDEDFLAALAIMPRGQRDRAWLRQAGDARDRRVPHRTGHMDASPIWHGRTMRPSTASLRSAVGPHRSRSRASRQTGRDRAIAETYAIGVTGAVAALIDPADPRDPIARQFVPDLAELTSGQTKWPIRPAISRSARSAESSTATPIARS